ncbi:MAG: hypothetical protein AAF928_06920 [Myxococcota bacterium]
MPSAPAAASSAPPADDVPGRPRLRLVVTRGALGVELETPVMLGPLRVTALAATFPDVTFPIALGGGIGDFRHRRGRLHTVDVNLEGGVMRRWARPRLDRALATKLDHFVVVPIGDGAMIGLTTVAGAALAFDVVAAPTGDDVRLFAVEARGLGLSRPPFVVAVQVLEALCRPHGELVVGAVVVRGATRKLVRRLMPDAGMRAPATKGMAWTSLGFDEEGVTARAEVSALPFALSPRAVRAVETHALAAEADTEALNANWSKARRAYLQALSQTSRHVALARRLAELDRAHGAPPEAALGALTEVASPLQAGVLGASLLSAQGDEEGARVAYRRAAIDEPYGGLAARCWLEVARFETDGDAALACIDEAIARAPGAVEARWLRVEHRVRRGALEAATADVAHLSLAAEGGSARHAVWQRYGEQLVAARHLGRAREAFERALRYLPDDVETVAGLARVLAFADDRRRALELLSRAVGLARRRRQRADGVVVELAIALAEVADDRPAAIAHVRSIEADADVGIEARALEARWCADVGDLAGADRAITSLQYAVEAVLPALTEDDAGPADRVASRRAAGSSTREDRRSALAMHLWEAARIQRDARHEPARARQLLALALRLAPHHRGIAEAFRRVAAELDLVPEPPVTSAGDGEARRSLEPPPTPEREPSPSAADTSATAADEHDDDDDDDDDEAARELRVEQLTVQLRADPERNDLAVALARLLVQLGRDHELLALVSGRIEDYGDAPTWTSFRREALERLRDQARAAGREEEAALYATMLDAER